MLKQSVAKDRRHTPRHVMIVEEKGKRDITDIPDASSKG